IPCPTSRPSTRQGGRCTPLPKAPRCWRVVLALAAWPRLTRLPMFLYKRHTLFVHQNSH
ncbi:hypothetical protein HAX54_034336, partial [Datura stramonium]|nr:hypothetical protein [Datura stramonium]